MMEHKYLIAEEQDALLAQLHLEQPHFELPLRLTLPEKIFLTRKFEPTFCTCGKHCSHEPQYHMERTVFRLDLLSGSISEGDRDVYVKEKLKAANFIIESTEVEGEDETELFRNKKTEFVKQLVARLRDEDVHRLQDYFEKEGRITLTGFDSLLLCKQRKRPSKTKSVKAIEQKAVSCEVVSLEFTAQIHQAQKTAKERTYETGQKLERAQKVEDINSEFKKARLFEKFEFNKEIADVVQAYEAEYKESKEDEKESVAKRVNVTHAFDSEVKKTAKEKIYPSGQKAEIEQKHIDIYNESKSAQLFDKLDFKKEIADIVQAYEAEYKESEEDDKESIEDNVDVTDSFAGDFASNIVSAVEQTKGQLSGEYKEVGYVPCSLTAVRDDVMAALDILISKNKDQTYVSGLSSQLIVAPYVTIDFSQQIKDIVRAYEAEYMEAEEIQDLTTDNIIGPFETYPYHNEFESEPDYILVPFENGDNKEDNKNVPEMSQAESSCPLDAGSQKAEANIFTDTAGVTEEITAVVKNPSFPIHVVKNASTPKSLIL